MASSDRLKREKAQMRASIAAARDAIPPSERQTKGLVIADTLVDLLAGRGRVMVFRSFRSEVPTGPIAERLAAEGHPLALPHLERPDGGGADVVPVEWEPGESLVVGTFDIEEPADLRRLDPIVIDAVLVPGLAFDRAGYRVGYGGGFYDRFLPKLRSDADRVAIGFHEQLVDAVPHGTIDEPVDLLVTDREVLRFQP